MEEIRFNVERSGKVIDWIGLRQDVGGGVHPMDVHVTAAFRISKEGKGDLVIRDANGKKMIRVPLRVIQDADENLAPATCDQLCGMLGQDKRVFRYRY